jgi:hypothetical protein
LEKLPSADLRVESGLPKEIEGQFRLWEKQVPEIWGEHGVHPCQDKQEVTLKSADGALRPIPAVHVWGDELELGFPLDGDGFLVRGASLIVENLEVNGKAACHQPCHDSIVGHNPMTVIPGLESLLEDEVAIGMEGNHHILVAQARLDQKATHVVSVQPAEGVYFDEDLMGWYVQRRRMLAGGRWGRSLRRIWLGLG